MKICGINFFVDKHTLKMIYSRSNNASSNDALLTSISSVTKYTDFLDEIEKERKNFFPAVYSLKYFDSEKTVYLFKLSISCEAAEVVFKYTPESQEFLDLTLNLFGLTDGKTEISFVKSSENYNTLGISNLVLRVIYARKDIESSGEEVFSKFKLTSKNGKVRDIIAPHDKIKVELQKMNRLLQKVYDNRNRGVQVAYKRGMSVKTNACRHKNHKYVFNIDIKDFFPSCSRDLVRKYTNFLFKGNINRDYVEEEFLNTILIDDALFIGSPISGTLANAILSGSITYLNRICKKYGMTVSVYADDISFSSNKFITKEYIYDMIAHVFEKYELDSSFKINESKSVGFSGSRRKITGVAINDKNELTIPRRYYRELRSKIANLANGDLSINIEKLRGKIAYATMIDDSGKVKKYLKKYEPTVKKYNLYSGVI